MPRPQPANERAVSPHSRNERITREWYQENPEKVRSAQSEAENIHMVAAIKVEESIESVFAELGIANAGYTFRYLNESLADGKYGLFVLVTEAAREVTAPEPVIAGQRKAGDEKSKKASIWTNYSEGVTQALVAKFAEDNLPVKVKAIVYGNAIAAPIEVAADAERAFSKVRPLALAENEVDFSALITREELRDHALSPELDISNRASTLFKVANQVARRVSSEENPSKEQELTSLVAKRIADEIKGRMQKAGALQSDLMRIPSTKEMSAVAKIRAYAKVHAEQSIVISEIGNVITLDETESKGLNRILFKLEGLPKDKSISWRELETVLEDYAKGGDYDTRYQNLSVVARLVLPEGTKLPGGKTTSGLFSASEAQTEEEIADALEKAIKESLIDGKKNFITDTVLHHNGLNVSVPKTKSGDIDYEKVHDELSTIVNEVQTENPQVRILQERARLEVVERSNDVASTVEDVSRIVSSIQSQINEHGLSALSTMSASHTDKLVEKLSSAESQTSAIVQAIAAIIAETKTHELSEAESRTIIGGFEALLKQADALTRQISGLRTTINTFMLLVDELDKYQVDVQPEAVAEVNGSAKDMARLARESAKIEKSLQKEQAEVKKYALLKEFSYFGDTELVFEANELYLQCLEKVVDEGWEAAATEIESFTAFVKANADAQYHGELLATVNSFEAFNVELSPADRGRRLLDLGRELIGRITNAASVPKYIELTLSWAAIVLISQKINVLISQYGVSITNETIVEGLKYAGFSAAVALGIVDANAKAAIVESVADVNKRRAQASVLKQALAGAVFFATAVVSDSVQTSQLQTVTADSLVSGSRGAANATRESLENAEASSQAYQAKYQAALNLYTVGVIITETGLGVEQLPSIRAELVAGGFYGDESSITFGTEGVRGVGPKTLKKIYALYGEIPAEIEVLNGKTFELVDENGVSYKELFEQYLSERPEFQADIDTITQARAELQLGAKERVTDEVAGIYGEFAALDVGADIDAPLEKYFDAVDRIEELKTLRAQLVALFLNGEKPNRYDLERYANQTNQEIDEAITEFETLALDIKRLQANFNAKLQTVDAAIELPTFDEYQLIPDLEKLATDIKTSEIPEPTLQLERTINELIPDQHTARLIAEAEARRLAPNDPDRQREIAADIEQWNVTRAWGIGLVVALIPFVAGSLPNAAFIARKKRKGAAEELPKMKALLKQDAKKIAGFLNAMLAKQAISQSFPKIEPYMVHRVLTELAAKMDTEDLGFDGENKNGVAKEWLYSMVSSISDDADTRSVSAIRRIAGRTRTVGDEEQGIAVYVLERLVPGYMQRLREHARGDKSGEVGEAFESKNLALHYAERIQFIQGRISALEAHKLKFGQQSENYAELLRSPQELTESGQAQLKRYLAIERALETANHDMKEAEAALSRHSVGAALQQGNRGQLVVPEFTFTAHTLSIPTGMLEYAEDEIAAIENSLTDDTTESAATSFAALTSDVTDVTEQLEDEYDGVEISSVASLFNPKTNTSTITTTIRPNSADAAVASPITLTIPVSSRASNAEVIQEVKRKVAEAIAYEHAIQRELKSVVEKLQRKYPQAAVSFNFEGLFGTAEKSVSFTITDTKSKEPIVEARKLRVSASVGGENIGKAMQGKADHGVITTLLRVQIEKTVESLIVTHQQLEQDVSEAAHLFAANSEEYLFMPEFTLVETERGYAVAMSITIRDGEKTVYQQEYVTPLNSDESSKTRREIAHLLKESVRSFVESVKLPRVKAALETEFKQLQPPSNKAESVTLKSPADIKGGNSAVERLFAKETQRVKAGMAKSVFQKVAVAKTSTQVTLEQSITALLPDSSVEAVRKELRRIEATDVPTLPSQAQLFRFVSDEAARAQQEASPIKFALVYGNNPNTNTLSEQLYLTIKRDSKKPPTIEYVDMATIKASV